MKSVSSVSSWAGRLDGRGQYISSSENKAGMSLGRHFARLLDEIILQSALDEDRYSLYSQHEACDGGLVLVTFENLRGRLFVFIAFPTLL
jgi:hypothetical protein